MSVDFETICCHEAAHAVARFLVGLPCTKLTADEDGGFTAGTGRAADPRALLFVMLAGVSYEAGFGIGGDIGYSLKKSKFDDLDQARALLAACPQLRVAVKGDKAIIETVEASLRRHFKVVCNELVRASGIIGDLGFELGTSGKMAAREVKAFLSSEIDAEWRCEVQCRIGM